MLEPIAEEAALFMAAAVRADGRTALADGRTALAAGEEEADSDSRADTGLQLLRLVFGTHDPEGNPAAGLRGLMDELDDEELAAELIYRVRDELEADAQLASAAISMITAHYRRQAAAGHSQAQVALGDFLRWQDPQGSRAAYQEAIDAGQLQALIGLAGLLRAAFQDDQGALGPYQQAIDSGNADLAAEASYCLGRLLLRLDDPVGARDAYQQAIDSGNAEWAANASIQLGRMLQKQGDIAGAKTAWQRVIDSGDAEYAAAAFTELVNLLREHGDVPGLRAAHRLAVQKGNSQASYALDVIGQLLIAQADSEGAHLAWQQAMDAGYEYADMLLGRMPPSGKPEPEDDPEDEDELADLPPQFDRRNVLRTGMDVLDHGLPTRPDVLSYQMAIPVAYWKAGRCAVVLVLRFSRQGREQPAPVAMQVTYSRTEDGWAPSAHVHGAGFGHDPIASPGDRSDLGGRPMVSGASSSAAHVTPGHPAYVLTGRAAPEVKFLAVIQDGQENRRPLESHFGAWVVCTESLSPFRVEGIAENGTVLASLQHPFEPGRASGKLGAWSSRSGVTR